MGAEKTANKDEQPIHLKYRKLWMELVDLKIKKHSLTNVKDSITPERLHMKWDTLNVNTFYIITCLVLSRANYPTYLV